MPPISISRRLVLVQSVVLSIAIVLLCSASSSGTAPSLTGVGKGSTLVVWAAFFAGSYLVWSIAAMFRPRVGYFASIIFGFLSAALSFFLIACALGFMKVLSSPLALFLLLFSFLFGGLLGVMVWLVESLVARRTA